MKKYYYDKTYIYQLKVSIDLFFSDKEHYFSHIKIGFGQKISEHNKKK